ncbi:VWA-like domain-containing protein [Fulvivirga maritima]|uniref:vWA domain-containing protein n=1 Tax=Fulvivirga maritima TaxID=2904247 RepID=UPI001F284124|nr:VWA-like domain-containing protein [Fulvivirga maritima]UII25879.1 VWA-like domain-containing protein [Fulvivirga maritima]
MAVGCRKLNHVLYINNDFWNNVLTSKEYRLGVIKHEVLHIIFKHTLVNQKNYDSHILNIAMDLVVNQMIERNQLPAESIFLDNFPELNLDAEMGWQYYYRRLMELQENHNGQFSHTKAYKNLQSIDRNSHGLERHATWFEIFQLPELDKSLLESGIDYLIVLAHGKMSNKAWGTLPAHFRRYLEAIIVPKAPQVDWRRALKLFTESSRKTYIKSTLKRPSRRYGTIPGVKVRRIQKLLIAIDTSGSVSKSELTKFFQELYHIYRSGSEIQVVECDAKIGKIYNYKGITPDFVTGGGGTNFSPPVEYANTQYHPDALIYFTDGVAPAPNQKSRCPIMWIISENGLSSTTENYKELPGIKVKMIKKD